MPSRDPSHNHCDSCQLHPGEWCLLAERGQCDRARHEAVIRDRVPGAVGYWTGRAIAAARPGFDGPAVLILHHAAHVNRGPDVDAAEAASVLTAHGVPSAVAGVDTLADAAGLIGSRARLVVCQSAWFGYDEVADLAARRPWVRFVFRMPSNLAFMAADGRAFELLMEHARRNLPNVYVGAVSHRLAEWWSLTQPGRMLHLPYLYLPPAPPPRPPGDPAAPLKVGAFGLMRIQKHTAVAAAAAVVLARLTGRQVEFHCHPTGPAPAVLPMIRRMFAGRSDVTLVEEPWRPRAAFRAFAAGMDLGMQPSASETFNGVTADLAAMRVPSVVGEAIDWLGSRCPDMVAPVDDAVAVARAAARLLADPTAGDRARAALEVHTAAGVAAWLDFLGSPPAPVPIPAHQHPPSALAELATVRACPYRADPQSCGCSATATCQAGHIEFPTDGTVSLGYCLRCPDRPAAPGLPIRV